MDPNGIAYGTNLFVAVGNSGTILTSPDGISWSPQFGGTLVNLNTILYGNGLFVAVGAQGTIITSPDGINWTSQASGVQVGLGSIAFGEGTFCTVTAGNQTNMVALTSTDGISWKPRRTDALHQLTIKPLPAFVTLMARFSFSVTIASCKAARSHPRSFS